MPRRQSPFYDWSTIALAAVVALCAAIVWRRDGLERVFDVILEDSRLFLNILPKVLAGTLIGAFLAVALPRDLVTRWVGAESGLSGLLVATFAGVLLPGGPFTVYPLAAAFLVAGADIGAVVAFATSWALLGLVRGVVWELPFFGIDFVVWRTLMAIPLPVVAGLLARALAGLMRPGRTP